MRTFIKSLLVAGCVLVSGCTIPVEASTTTRAPYEAQADDSDSGLSDAEIDEMAFNIAWDENGAELCATHRNLIAEGMDEDTLIEIEVAAFLDSVPDASAAVISMLRHELRNC